MLNLFMTKNCIIGSLILNLTILSSCDGYKPKLRIRRSVPVDEGIKNDRSLSEMQWSDIIDKFGLNADANPVLLEISNQNTIDCDGEMISVDINNLQPVPIYSSSAHCVHDDIDEHCHTEVTTTYTGSTSDGQQFIVTFDSEFNVRTVDCGECHMERIFPRLMAKICEDDISDFDNENDLFEDDDDSIDDSIPDQERKLLPNLIQKYGSNTSLSAIGDGYSNGKSRSLISEDDYCEVYQETKIAISFDTTFCNAEGSYEAAVTEVQNIVARASIAFESQGVCIKIAISHIDGHCDETTDPYAAGIALNNIGCYDYGLMRTYKTHVLSVPELKNADASHLFFHKKLTETARTVGCANYKKICSTYSVAYGVNDMRFSSDEQRRGYLFAHELGHNFGMSHSNHFDGNKAIMKGASKSGIHVWAPQNLADFKNLLDQPYIQNCLTEVPNPIAPPTASSPIVSPTPPPNPTSSPVVTSPTASPVVSPTSSPSSEIFQPILSCERFVDDTFVGGWSNTKTTTSDAYGEMLGRWYVRSNNDNQGSSKRFDVSEVSYLVDEIIIRFRLFEFDQWEGDEQAAVIINQKRIELGEFASNRRVETSRSGSVDGILWTLEPDQSNLFISDWGHRKQEDEIHFVTITVPKDVYSQLGYIDLEFSFEFKQNKNQESAGITDLVMEACSL